MVEQFPTPLNADADIAPAPSVQSAPIAHARTRIPWILILGIFVFCVVGVIFLIRYQQASKVTVTSLPSSEVVEPARINPAQPVIKLSAQTNPSWKTYTDTNNLYRLQYPNDWEMKEVSGVTKFGKYHHIAFTPPDKAFTFKIGAKKREEFDMFFYFREKPPEKPIFEMGSIKIGALELFVKYSKKNDQVAEIFFSTEGKNPNYEIAAEIANFGPGMLNSQEDWVFNSPQYKEVQAVLATLTLLK